ncbi:MAG TPA: choice-of-anchor Q domain-containing protein [Anaerolineales bacterium]
MIIDHERFSSLISSLFFSLFMLGATFVFLAGQPSSASTAGCQVPSPDYATVQSAIDDDTCESILIASGTYTQALLIDRSVSLIGAGPDVTILDGELISRPVTIVGSNDQNGIAVSLNGLRITGGNANAAINGMYGGGVLVVGGAQLQAENLKIDHNLASTGIEGYGGGLAVDGGSVMLTNTLILSNTATERSGQSEGSGYGGGIYITDGDLRLTGSQIKNNLAAYRAGDASTDSVASGGGLYIGENTRVSLSANLWSGNVARGSQSRACSLLDCSGEGQDEGGGAVGAFLNAGTALITITNDVFTDNIANDVLTTAPNSGRGGAISLNTIVSGQITASITGASLNGNVAAWKSLDSSEQGRGGGIYARQTELLVAAAEFFENQAVLEGNGNGGGIYFHFPRAGESLDLLNSVLAGNIACTSNDCGDGAQVYINYTNPISNTARIVHTTLADQALNPRQAIYYFSEFPGDTLYLTNTIITSHTVGIEIDQGNQSHAFGYGLLFHGNTITHTGDAFLESVAFVPGQPDPLFVDPQDHDYHIQSGSSAIDNGVDSGITLDLDGELRPQGEGFDIGADELPESPPSETPTFTPSPSPSSTPKPSTTPTPTKIPTITPTTGPAAKNLYLPLVIR